MVAEDEEEVVACVKVDRNEMVVDFTGSAMPRAKISGAEARLLTAALLLLAMSTSAASTYVVGDARSSHLKRVEEMYMFQ